MYIFLYKYLFVDAELTQLNNFLSVCYKNGSHYLSIISSFIGACNIAWISQVHFMNILLSIDRVRWESFYYALYKYIYIYLYVSITIRWTVTGSDTRMDVCMCMGWQYPYRLCGYPPSSKDGLWSAGRWTERVILVTLASTRTRTRTLSDTQVDMEAHPYTLTRAQSIVSAGASPSPPLPPFTQHPPPPSPPSLLPPPLLPLHHQTVSSSKTIIVISSSFLVYVTVLFVDYRCLAKISNPVY